MNTVVFYKENVIKEEINIFFTDPNKYPTYRCEKDFIVYFKTDIGKMGMYNFNGNILKVKTGIGDPYTCIYFLFIKFIDLWIGECINNITPLVMITEYFFQYIIRFNISTNCNFNNSIILINGLIK